MYIFFLVGYCLAKANRCTSSRVYFLFKKKHHSHTRTYIGNSSGIFHAQYISIYISFSFFSRKKIQYQQKYVRCSYKILYETIEKKAIKKLAFLFLLSFFYAHIHKYTRLYVRYTFFSLVLSQFNQSL